MRKKEREDNIDEMRTGGGGTSTMTVAQPINDGGLLHDSQSLVVLSRS